MLGRIVKSFRSRSETETDRDTHFSKLLIACLFCILLASIVFKLFLLNSKELELDDTYSAFIANLAFAKLLHTTARDVHPPLFYMLLWAWVRIAGDTEARLRLFNVILSIGSTFGMFVLSRRVLGTRFGAFAASLFALSPILLENSLDVRMYVLSVLVFVCLLFVHWLIVVEQNHAKWLIAIYALLAAMLFYVHYMAVFALLALFAHWLIISRLAWSRVRTACAAAILITALVAPGIPTLLSQRAAISQQRVAMQIGAKDPSSLSFGNYLYEPGPSYLAGQVAWAAGFNLGRPVPLLLVCAVPLTIVLAGAVYLWVANGDPVCSLFGLVMLAVGVGIFALHLYPSRYMILVVPPFLLAIGRVLQYWEVRWRTLSFALGVLILFAYGARFIRLAVKPSERPWESIVTVLQREYRPGDQVLFNVLFGQVPFDYYSSHSHFFPQEDGFPASIYNWWRSQEFEGWGGPGIVQSDLDKTVAKLSSSRPRIIWLVEFETFYYDPHDLLLAKLSRLGQVTEFHLTSGQDSQTSETFSPRLIRININR
jgi:mannosyltransferase